MQAVSRMAQRIACQPSWVWLYCRMSPRLTATYQLPLQALCQPSGYGSVYQDAEGDHRPGRQRYDRLLSPPDLDAS